ncbi:MAG: hypothetical protein OHK006_23290 [Thermodesulfovibrionales bacterium]
MSSRTAPLRVFLLEDNADDVEIELYQLKKAGLDVEHQVARNRREFLERVESFRPEIILADYALPDLTGTEALALCRERNLDVPVILITGEGNEMIAVDSLRLGAVDYILKRNIAGLGPRVLRALEIFADRRAKKRAEAEERRLQEVLHETQKMEAIGRLAGGVAHDFNNILTGIMGFADLCLREAGPGSPLAGRLQSIISFSQRGADLVKQLLIFSRKMALEFVDADLNVFVRETAAFFRRIVGEAIEIRLELGDGPLTVRCDRAQMTQMLMNLVLNARDAMHERGVITIRTVRCACPDLPEPAGEGECACLSVADTGEGIARTELANIFEPFYTTKGPGKGTGLGLSIVYSVVTAHRGAVRVESVPGTGTTFLICLPLVSAPSSGETSPFYDRLPRGSGVPRGNGETILLAEDERELRDMLASFLRNSGFRVIEAADGDEALRIYRAQQAGISLVVSDMCMPNRGGVELFQAIRELDPTARFMLVTGYSLVDVEEGVLGSMNAVLMKPYTPSQVVEAAVRILES